jgi:hypothetical protein
MLGGGRKKISLKKLKPVLLGCPSVDHLNHEFLE